MNLSLRGNKRVCELQDLFITEEHGNNSTGDDGQVLLKYNDTHAVRHDESCQVKSLPQRNVDGVQSRGRAVIWVVLYHLLVFRQRAHPVDQILEMILELPLQAHR